MNLTAIYTANALGVSALVTALICNRAIMKSSRHDFRILKIILFVTTIACILDPIVFTVDGHAGPFMRFINIFGNTYEYLGNIWVSMLWIDFLKYHLYGDVIRMRKKVRYESIPVGILTVSLLVNIFYPFAFYLDDSNIYHRLPGAWVFVTFMVLSLLYSVLIYEKYKKVNGHLRFFPIGMFLIPILIGFLAQEFHYGISTSWPAVAIALCGLLMSLQNEMAYVDNLTGILNRSYLFNTKVYEDMAGAIMIDVNHFKEINDQYGHASGDKVLQEIAAILQRVSLDYGFAVRYAGDEFLVFSRDGSNRTLREIRDRINAELEELRRAESQSYEISLSFGLGTFIPQRDNIDDFIRILDENMYADKKEYYRKHAERNRRKLDR